VPNDKGAVRAVDAGVDEIHTVVSASESHNLANVNMTIAESLTKLGAVAEVARRAGVPVVSGISCSFGCPFERRAGRAAEETAPSSTWARAASGSPTPPGWPTPPR
jgi:isopropylmalate/homocitrate/citramalate synthase